MFFLPDWQTHLDLIDDKSAGLEFFIAILSRDANPDGEFANFQRTLAMHTARADERKFLPRLGQYAFTFGNSDGFVYLVFEPSDLPPLIAVTDPALKNAEAACTRIRKRLAQRHGIDRLLSDL